MYSGLKQRGLIPEGGAVVEQEAEQLCAVTVGVRPHGVPGAHGQQSSTTPVSAPCGGGDGGDAGDETQLLTRVSQQYTKSILLAVSVQNHRSKPSFTDSCLLIFT